MAPENGSHGMITAKPTRPPTRRNSRLNRVSPSMPGGTRTPNLLVRRSPSAVRGRPQPSTNAGTTDFRVHRHPCVSTLVHTERLPTWLPGHFRRGCEAPRIWRILLAALRGRRQGRLRRADLHPKCSDLVLGARSTQPLTTVGSCLLATTPKNCHRTEPPVAT
jgi:hypothetical protein